MERQGVREWEFIGSKFQNLRSRSIKNWRSNDDDKGYVAWKEVIPISESRWDDIVEETTQLKPLVDKEAIAAMGKGNMGVLCYLVNMIYRIKKCVDDKILWKIRKRKSDAMEKALSKFNL